MDSLPFKCLLEFAAGWSPPRNKFQASRTRWQTWRAFMADWLAIRDEYMQHEQWGTHPVFAEQILKTFGAKGPPADFGYDEIHAAIAAAEDRATAELLADVDV